MVVTKSMGKFQRERMNFNKIFLKEDGLLLHYRYKDIHIRLEKEGNLYKWKANMFIKGIRPFSTFSQAYEFMNKRLREGDMLCI